MSDAYEIVWAPSAIQDLDDILEYTTSQRGVEAAEKLYENIVRRVQTLSRYPSRARAVPELKNAGIRDYRELILSPYRIPFRILGKNVAILGVFDGRRELTELLLKRALEPFPFE